VLSHRHTSFDDLAGTAGGGPPIDSIADRRASVSEQVERREVAEIVTHILLTVERRARIVWAMRYLEGRSPDEVVSALGITHRQYARLYERANTAINRKLLAVPRRRLVSRPRGEIRAAGRQQGRRPPRPKRRASTSTPARVAGPRTRRSRGFTPAARDLTESVARVARVRRPSPRRPAKGGAPVMATAASGDVARRRAACGRFRRFA